MAELTISHHLLRRTARLRAHVINALAKSAQDAHDPDCMWARQRLAEKYGLPRSFEGGARVEKALRGPWRYRVVAETSWDHATALPEHP